MKNILAIGSLTSDTFLKPRKQEVIARDGFQYLSLRLGDKMIIEDRCETFGGGGANLAVGLARFGGIKAAVLGRIGDDETGKQILVNLAENGVNAEAVQIGTGEMSGFSVVLSTQTGERTILFSPGANNSFADFEEDILFAYDGVCLQHLAGCSQEVFQKIHDFFLKHPDRFLSWNPGSDSLEQGVDAYADLLAAVDVISLNLQEAQLFTKKMRVKDIFQTFYQAGFQGRAIVTDGPRGALGCDGTHLYFCSVDLESKRVDTLGAGDSYLCGVVGATLNGKNLQEAMKVGTMNAASVVGHYGAQKGLRSLADLERVTHKIRVDTKPFSF